MSERHLVGTLYNSAKLFKSSGTWNIKEIDGTVKREEVVGVFRKGMFELLELIKLKGNREVS